MGIPVFIRADNIDVPIIATIMASICTNTKSEINFYIIDRFISQGNKKKLAGCRQFFSNFTIDYIRIDLKPWFTKYPVLVKFDRYAFIKYIMPTLKPELDKAIFIDKDIIFQKGSDIEALYKTDLQGQILAAVPLVTLFGNGLWSRQKVSNIGTLGLSSRDAVFDPGLILVDMKKWKQEEITDKLFQTTEALKNGCMLFDSYDGMFKLFDGQYIKLDRTWNIPYHYAKIFFFGKTFNPDDMKVLHYNYSGDNNKPWNNKGLDGSEYFWKYTALTKYQDILTENPPSRIHDPQYWAKLKFRRKILNSIIKCLVSKKRYSKLKKHTDQFFADSKSRFIRFLGEYYF